MYKIQNSFSPVPYGLSRTDALLSVYVNETGFFSK